MVTKTDIYMVIIVAAIVLIILWNFSLTERVDSLSMIVSDLAGKGIVERPAGMMAGGYPCPVCNDIDGINFYVTGAAIIRDNCTGSITSEGDACGTGIYSSLVYEKTCDARATSGFGSIQYRCPNGCKSGHCK